MDPRNNERISTASNEDSILQYANDKKSGTKRRRRACPILILLALVIHLLSSGCGITISVLVVRFGLETSIAGRQDLVSRILLFVSSCIGNVYILMHVFASREKYVRSLQNGSPQIHGYFFAAMSVLIARLSVPVWIATVVMNAIVAAMVGFNLGRGLKANVVWIQLLIASVALLSILVVLIVIETTDRPFATSILSRRSFITATEQGGRNDTFDLSISRQGIHPPEGNRENKKEMRNTVVELQRESFDRSRINTPESSDDGSPVGQNNAPSWTDRSSRVEQRMSTRRNTMRVRSQAVPTPLETIFGSRETLPDPRNSPGIKGDFSWRPPTRDSEYIQRPPTRESYRDTLQPRSNAASTVFSNLSAIPQPLTTDPSLAPRVPDTFAPANEPASRQSIGPQRSSSVPPAATQLKPPTQRRPTLPNLTDLPARAAARRRNSLIAREADLDPRASREISRRFSIIGQNIAPPSPRNDFVEVPIPDIRPRELETDEDGIIPVEAHPLARNNSTRARLVRNFSRPRRRSTMVGPADIVMDRDRAKRTSSFLPEPARERGRIRKQGGNIGDDWGAEVRRSKSVPPVASNTRAKRVSLAIDEPRSKPPTARLPRKPVAGPRFSPFPTTAAPERRVKGLGQGSTRRLDQEVARWVEGVQAPRTSSDAPPSIISVSTDILDPEITVSGRRSSTKLSREGSISGRTRRIAQNF
ncbi:hypothetical protein J7T55_001381 [Diaporthe amygdali]|uniref:uncharacterized protein n=1 Tax=Phomopsis amygdali TaxID=1214568 RepID=UPI0022FE04CB|nr:uncharacterized protein J7T55_001381 [Diaporthe amygdali]KAJ0114974.1 hypothetical protein J7T55_001381 [Diaporthe amygdali]